MTRQYPLIIFDFDGTMADSVSWAMTIISDVADKYGFKTVSPDDLERIRDYDPVSVFNELEIPLYKVPIIAAHLRKLMSGKAGQVVMHAGIEKALDHLSEKGITIAVVSSNSLENVRKIIGEKIASKVNYFECGATFWGKQHKLKKVLDKSGFSPDDALYVGDEVRDLQAARTTNVAFGAVAWGFNRLDAFMKYDPDEIFTDVSDLQGPQKNNAI